MPDPVNQDIIDEIKSRLENITTGNGYEFNVGTVEKVDRDAEGWRATERCVIIEQDAESENEEYFCPGSPPRVAFDLPIRLIGYAKRLDVDGSATGITDGSTTENQMIAAIKKAIANNDAGSWHTFGGKAVDASMTSEHGNDGEYDLGIVTLTVTYRVSEIDPFAVG